MNYTRGDESTNNKKNKTICSICKIPGHTTEKCFHLSRAQEAILNNKQKNFLHPKQQRYSNLNGQRSNNNNFPRNNYNNFPNNNFL